MSHREYCKPNLDSSRNIIILICPDKRLSYSIAEMKRIINNVQLGFIESDSNPSKFYQLTNGLMIDSSLFDCLNKKANTVKLVKNDNKFRLGDENQPNLIYYSAVIATREEICIQEESTVDHDWLTEQKVSKKIIEQDNGVKCLQTYINEIKVSEQWFKNEFKHRDNDNPAKVLYRRNGNLHMELWFQNDKLHRDGSSAVIIYDENGDKKHESWWKNGEPFRNDNLPTSVLYDKNGRKVERMIINNNRMCRCSRAEVCYNETCEEYSNYHTH